jgi:hydroxypyruvate reductase
MFDAAIAAAQPDVCIPAHLPEPPKGCLVVIGAGKASAAMACPVDKH